MRKGWQSGYWSRIELRVLFLAKVKQVNSLLVLPSFPEGGRNILLQNSNQR
jgi:hypothetical protein